MRDMSIRDMITTEELGKLCSDFEVMGRTYWLKSWGLGEPVDTVCWAQRQASAFYAEARSLRALILRRLAAPTG